MRSTVLALAALLPICDVEAQLRARSDRDALPPDVAREAARLYNDNAALRSTGRLEIEDGREIDGNVAVLEGPALIGGRVKGRVVAINSDVVLRPSARIDGDLIVVGGEVEGRHAAYVGGEIRIYRQSLRYASEGERIVADEASAGDESGWWRRWDRQPRRTSSKLQIATAGAYNRVEGWPINLGPQVYFNEPWGSVRFNAYAVLRTGTTFGNDDDIGHDVNTELRLGRWGGLLLGGRLFDIVEPTDDWQLKNVEAGLSAFVLRRDYRDYYERRGGQLRAGAFIRRGADLSIGYSDERWDSRGVENPWTLFRSSAAWRANPSFDVGSAHLLNTTLRVDTRNDADDPWSGWYVNADVENGWATITAYAPRSAPVGQPAPSRLYYTRGFADVRSYNRISPDAQVNFRIVAGGWLNGDPLPLQKRFAVDGPGSMPGYDFRSPSASNVLTCTSGAYVIGLPGQCDRMALAQVEYRGDLHFDLFTDWEDDHYARSHSDGNWVFFADAGRGWLVGTPMAGDEMTYSSNSLPAISTFRTDIGLGLDFDLFGVYVAKSMSQPKEPANFFVRIRHRF